MDWVKDFYTRKSEWFGPSGILDHHRARAATVERLTGPGPKRVLELGAGAGGSAAATADLGHSVTAIELSPLRVAYARELATIPRAGSLTILEADFFTVDLAGPFDVITYWNGFGIGSDADQRRLLQRIAAEWLAPDGCVLMDVFSPWQWARVAGNEERDEESGLMQRSDFDPLGCRFLDQWWSLEQPADVITQSIRCYSPADLLLLLQDTGLVVQRWEIDGAAFDPLGQPQNMTSPLWATWDYFVQLVPAGRA
ncbi:MAG TPA: class I SAM-dependent methyltransferase [Herpetosiphonaceae bacterium]